MTPWILARAARTPDAPALVAGTRVLSWCALAARARARAAALAARGVRPGDRVAVLLGNEPAFVELLHASFLVGATFVPLHVRLAPSELERQLEDSEPRLVVHAGGALGEKLACPRAARASLEELERGEAARGVPAATAPMLSAPAAIVHTSGTSGAAKGVVLTHGNLLASAVASALHLGALPADRWLACLPLFHVGGLAILVRSVLAGSAVVLHEHFEPLALARALDGERITGLSLVPTMLARLLEVWGDAPPPPTLRTLLLGGAAAPAPLLERAERAGWPLLPTWGMTETASQAATLPPGARLRADGGGLVPLPGIELRIVDAAGNPLPSGAEGTIAVRGPMVTPGYWRRPAASVRAPGDGWLRTGDRGLLEAGGTLRVLGRADDVIVTGGENVHPVAVEAVLLAHPEVAEAGVAGIPDSVYGERVAAWIVPRPGMRAEPEALERFARARLGGHQLPRVWHHVDALPRNAGGKLLRAALRERAAAARQGASPAAASPHEAPPGASPMAP